MLTKLQYTVSQEILQEAQHSLSITEYKSTINQPIGNFFYDPWEIKPKYQGTVWQKILDTLPTPIGEARIIVLKPGTCYKVHTDIDDRYHLNITGHYAYLLNVDTEEVDKINTDGHWYDMDASPKHSAINLGIIDRVQLVVRKLLVPNTLKDAVTVKITTDLNAIDGRFFFDETISGWLNQANKKELISNFNPTNDTVIFDIEKDHLGDLKKILPDTLNLEIV
jgi:hypothetical protein